MKAILLHFNSGTWYSFRATFNTFFGQPQLPTFSLLQTVITYCDVEHKTIDHNV